MSFWDKVLNFSGKGDAEDISKREDIACPDRDRWAFIDIEVGLNDKKIHDIGAIRYDGAKYRNASKQELLIFLSGVDFVCGHNIIHHDAKYLWKDEHISAILVDTLYMSPILFAERPYHRLVKDDKLVTEHLNNPVNDCMKAQGLLREEIAKWNSLEDDKQRIFTSLLYPHDEFRGFLQMVGAQDEANDLSGLIRDVYGTKICVNADIENLISNYPCELAYALALIDTQNHYSITPGWVLHTYPNVEYVVNSLRAVKCRQGCVYCNTYSDVHHNLKSMFGYDAFRTYDGEPLQQRAAEAAVQGKSLLAIFPTGGGKSLTFQLPALMAGKSVHGLTIVISPLQSLMKDQVDNLAQRGIADAETINGLLDPISRSLAIQRVMNGDASILYIAPEMLRSKTIERILLVRNVVRFVIDESHCFSSWGQDFRVDYLYIGKFIKEYQEKKSLKYPIPVSCFTATAKQKVIQDICDYFNRMLGINLEIFASSASRKNLKYSVIHTDTDEDKYIKLRNLISQSDTPTIVYVSRTKRTEDIAKRLTRDGYAALPFNGKMERDKKVENQDAFMSGKVSVIVAISAFGLGVDKSDVGLVVHYDISDSLENYVQEAGRAGRNPELSARCFVLYNDNDLDKHFILLNQTKLSISEIQQVWKSIKDMTRQRDLVCCSALEIARHAGWDDSVSDIETRVRTAISALEQCGYVERGTNVPHVYATGITVNNMEEARKRICESVLFDEKDVEKAIRVIKSLISEKYISKAQNEEAESRVDYLADILGLRKDDVISVVERMRQEGILADTKDITAFVVDGDTARKSRSLLDRFARLEGFILKQFNGGSLKISTKQINDNAVKGGIESSTEKDIRTILFFLTIKGYLTKTQDDLNVLNLSTKLDGEKILKLFQQRIEICKCIIERMFCYVEKMTEDEKKKKAVQFSVVVLLDEVKGMMSQSLFNVGQEIHLEELEESLLYLAKIGALKLDGGFLVLYNAMKIRRLKEKTLKYKKEDYRMLDEFYKQKIQQIHIVGEYANLMVKDYDAALMYVHDYFNMDYKKFISLYFKGGRETEIQRNLTPQRYKQIYSKLSERQMSIISDKESRVIVVAAGPGSGKTMLLVHKLASILQMEDVKHEQLLMLTFSRAAAMEFKQRLMQLIGNAAHFVEIKTFHSYCFDLLGLMGSLEDSESVVARASEMIRKGDVEPNKIGKVVLVIDECQDMSEDEYALVEALMGNNEDMRVIAVGDDDQNIFGFRGSDSKYMSELLRKHNGKLVEMTDNYRSCPQVVSVANDFVRNISVRLKSKPIVAISKDDGWVQVTHHSSHYLYHPIVDELRRNGSQGQVSVLTQTNEEAVILVALLRSYGMKAKLIQSMDDFPFWKLAEVRFFLKNIEKEIRGATVIADEVWEKVKFMTMKSYDGSTSLQYVRKCWELFEKTTKIKYLSDFKECLYESKIENFCDLTDARIVVSTIHRSKGREFDDVYMMLTKNKVADDALIRLYYVGMTRAKKHLFIHTNGHLFDRLPANMQVVDEHLYEMPDEVVLQLSHKDVNLGFFTIRKSEVLKLKGGDSLVCKDDVLYPSGSGLPVAKLSIKMKETLSKWAERGYDVVSASVRFVVAWRPQEASKDTPETAVLLPNMVLKKRG